ncbi:ribosome small subunit-dependent GTPase A [Paenibacillus sp. IB182496]|uniref:Small ribosomal subunit biogenesis GTPase RsgA n=1 Tax=Paenibacillus sabuli TaxID=2772509 RepID=A0A927BV99_9BACL|nr:ribosome small subunit-dependent GTPase A [Paenibacillus sabuli]MBD2846154.1 ribosome small subunit-dependent GTPase A [Paenibacillus sabuli]
MRSGRIVKALSGYYYVQPDGAAESGAPDDTPIQCRARGVFKKRGLTPLVGDLVHYLPDGHGEGTVTELLPRSSVLVRPPVANIELAVLVFAVTEPTLNLQLLDKFLAHIEHAGLETIICLSKQDLQDTAAERAVADVLRIYPPLGYDVYPTSALRGDGADALLQRLQGRLSVFAGQSGVGKSSLLNRLVPGLELETNAISNRLGRGKHTTRHVELIAIGGDGYVADTPGFSQLDFAQLGVEELDTCFPELRAHASDCRFRGCTHLHEPGCAVLEAKAAGAIADSRYDHYALFVEELKDKKRRY